MRPSILQRNPCRAISECSNLYVLEQLSDAAQVINNLVVAVFVAQGKLLARVEQSY
jgi:hypothetical protein